MCCQKLFINDQLNDKVGMNNTCKHANNTLFIQGNTEGANMTNHN